MSSLAEFLPFNLLMLKNLSISKKALIVVIGLLAVQLIFVCVLAVELFSLRKDLEAERQVQIAIEDLNQYAHLCRREMQALGIGSAMLLEDARATQERFKGALDQQRKLLENSMSTTPLERDLLNSFEQARIAASNCVRDEPLNFKKQIMLMKALEPATDNLRKHTNYARKIGSIKISASIDRINRLLLVGLGVNLLFAIIAVNFFKRVTTRLAVVTENVGRTAKQEPLLPRLTGNDEIVQIDAVFHQLSKDLIDAANNERSLFENSTDVICSLDSRGTFLEVSPAAVEQWGYKVEDLIGQEAAKVLSVSKVADIFNTIEEPVWRDSQFSFEEKLKRSDGKQIDSLWACHWSSADGSLFCFVRDNSEDNRLERLLKKQEAEVRNAIENMPLGIITIDARGLIQSINKETTRMFGTQELIGENIATILSFYDKEKTGSFLEVLANLNAKSSLRCDASAQGGRTWQAEVSSFPDPTHDGDLIVILEDISERVMLDELKKNFVTMLGKSLRDPLEEVGSIVLKRIEESNETDKATVRLKRVSTNLNRLMRLIDDLLDIQQLQAGKLTGELTPCAVQEITTTAVEVVRDHAEQKKIEIQTDNSPAFVLADSGRLVQVLVNLLTNAIKYSASDTTIRIEVPNVSQNDSVEIRVVDQGKGLPEHMRETIFKPYVQTEAQDARRGTGTGLGLSISRQIVELHGGTIGVDSREGVGSSFWIKLPKLRSES